MSGASIYRVPKCLHNLNKKAYTPRLVSIGPLHCKDQHLKTPMQDIKMNYVNSFLARMVGDSDERKLKLLKELINEMKIIEETKESSLLTDARKCYAEQVDDELDEEMLVIDGCFILELLYKSYERSTKKSQGDKNSDAHDPIFDSPLTFFPIQHDLLRLENQLPFSALDKLFLVTKKLMPTSSSYSSSSSRPLPDSLKPAMMTADSALPRQNSSGVKLQPCTSSEIKFYVVGTPFGWCRRARFEIPTLAIDDSTDLFFRNLIAFEQCFCFPGFERRFTSYANLMDKLISTVKDVEVLEKAGVIRDFLGSREEAVHLFNKLCKDVGVHPFHFEKSYKQATDYTKRRLPKAIAYLRREYFATPWTTIAFAVGLIAFGITLTNFIRSFLV